jgi:hypothetical protein
MMDRVIGFYESDVLSSYRDNPHRYDLDTDYFEGELKTSESHFQVLEEQGNENDYIHIRFGYHSKPDGTLCLAVYLPDLGEASVAERAKWQPFEVSRASLSDSDDRFHLWVARYMQADWGVKDGPRKRLAKLIDRINACCVTLVSVPLYTRVPDSSVRYPSSQNTHAYEDSHRDLYGFLVDCLSKDCLCRLADRKGVAIHQAEQMKATTLLRHVFALEKAGSIPDLLSKVSEERAKSSHGVRENAISCDAFGVFCKDLEIAADAYEELLGLLETAFDICSEYEVRRHESMQWLPSLKEGVEDHYSICQATQMIGKTVKDVRFGMREADGCIHQSEALHIEFSDGSILGIDTGSNVGNIASETSLASSEFHVDFNLTWVPGPSVPIDISR